MKEKRPTDEDRPPWEETAEVLDYEVAATNAETVITGSSPKKRVKAETFGGGEALFQSEPKIWDRIPVKIRFVVAGIAIVLLGVVLYLVWGRQGSAPSAPVIPSEQTQALEPALENQSPGPTLAGPLSSASSSAPPAKLEKSGQTDLAAQASLRLFSEPLGAAVKLDGRDLGVTPLEIRPLLVGRTYRVQLVHEGFVGQVIAVRPQASGPFDQRVVLAPMAKPRVTQKKSARAAEKSTAIGNAKTSGYLTVESSPWALVYIDGKRLDQITPIRRMSLSVGEHLVELRTPKGTKRSQRIRVEAGKEVRVRVDFP